MFRDSNTGAWEASTGAWEASTLVKSHSNSLLIATYSEHLHMSAQPEKNARDRIFCILEFFDSKINIY
jgi:hypothetical protein